MCQCSKCKKDFEETELTWTNIKGKMALVCGRCKNSRKEKVGLK
jgi:DNA-directed RNA polymerase subunit RPC12/RpoP